MLLDCDPCLIEVLLLLRIWRHNLTPIKRNIAASGNQNEGLIAVLPDSSCNLSLSALSRNLRPICLSLVSALNFVKLVDFKIKSRLRSFVCLNHYHIAVSSLVSLSAYLVHLLLLMSVFKTRAHALNALRIDPCCVVRLIRDRLLQRAIIKIYLRYVIYCTCVNTWSFSYRLKSTFLNVLAL